MEVPAGRAAAEMTTLLPDAIAPAIGVNVGVGQGASAVAPDIPDIDPDVVPEVVPEDPLEVAPLPPDIEPLEPLVFPTGGLLLPPHPVTAVPQASAAASEANERIAVPVVFRPLSPRLIVKTPFSIVTSSDLASGRPNDGGGHTLPRPASR